MATLINVCPPTIDLCISRGDTAIWTFTVKTGSPLAVVDITGFTYLLTVDPSDEPTGSGNNLFQLTGVPFHPRLGDLASELQARVPVHLGQNRLPKDLDHVTGQFDQIHRI